MSKLYELNKTFGKMLKEKRESRNFTQSYLAQKSGLSRSYISNLEVGAQDPSINTIFLLAQTLNIKPSVLIDTLEEKDNFF